MCTFCALATPTATAKGLENPVIWTKVDEDFAQVAFSADGQSEITLPNVPAEARLALVDMFITFSAEDHFVVDIGRDQNSNNKYISWLTNGGQPSASFPVEVETDQGIHQMYFGDQDGHSTHYGLWYSSLIISTDGATTYHGLCMRDSVA